MIRLVETCSDWKSNNKYRLCQTEYVALFKQNSHCCYAVDEKLILPYPNKFTGH
jgi:hypothetical protein